jgi:hypothetical protein
LQHAQARKHTKDRQHREATERSVGDHPGMCDMTVSGSMNVRVAKAVITTVPLRHVRVLRHVIAASGQCQM